MRTSLAIRAGAGAAGILLAVSACGSGGGGGHQNRVPEKSTSSAPAKQAAQTATLPNLVGMVLQDAQDKAQAAGFYNLDDQDALYTRLQVLDRNWKVCSQKPKPGVYDPNTQVVLYAVKLTEKCP